MKLKIAYFGSPQFSADFLEKILTDKDLKKIVSVEFVVTQPDKPVGRKQTLTPTSVKKIAIKYNIPIYHYHLKTQSSSWRTKLKSTSQNSKINKKILDLSYGFDICDLSFEIGLVYAYSQIIPKELLDLPRFGFWCFHPSLLPKYRGPSPIAYTLLNGDKKTGITIFKMDEKIDHGPIIAQKSLTIKNNDYRPDLEKKLTDLGFEVFKKIIINLVNSQNSLILKYQNNDLATYTKILKKEDGYIKYETLKKLINNEKINFEELPDLIKEQFIKNSNNQIPINKQILNSNNQNSKQKSFENLNLEHSNLFGNWKLEIGNCPKKIYDFFRALSPWPGVWTILPNGKRLKIIDLTINQFNNLTINTVQIEGKKPVDFQTFKKAYSLF